MLAGQVQLVVSLYQTLGFIASKDITKIRQRHTTSVCSRSLCSLCLCINQQMIVLSKTVTQMEESSALEIR